MVSPTHSLDIWHLPSTVSKAASASSNVTATFSHDLDERDDVDSDSVVLRNVPPPLPPPKSDDASSPSNDDVDVATTSTTSESHKLESQMSLRRQTNLVSICYAEADLDAMVYFVRWC